MKVCTLNEENKTKRVVIKVAISSSLKLRFKVLCIQKELTMSKVLEELIKKWIQADASISNFVSEPPIEDEDLKGYISERLKTQFKVVCTQKGITMRFALYNLINQFLIESDLQ